LRSLLLLLACYSPAVKEGQYLCPDQKCPPGQVCSACGICVGGNEAPHGGVACPGCAQGQRSDGDPGLPHVAMCAAAWLVPGISSDSADSLATPCGRQAGGDGTSTVDHQTGCSAEDNCAAGWHLCADETDLAARGLSRALCDALDDQAGSFWASRQPASQPNRDPTLPTCGSGHARIIGCGPLYAARAPAGCSLLSRYIGELPAVSPSPAWDCADHSDGSWQCGSDGNEARQVVKPRADHGGVICCRNLI
jgi:hypothetical protein